MDRARPILAGLTAALGAPIGLVGLALRPAWRAGWRERLGQIPEEWPLPADPIWIHAASAGEVMAAGGLVAHWRAEDRPLFASATSATGRALWASRCPDIPSSLAPLDHPWCVDRALDTVRPRALVLVETELWPVWIAAAARREVPVVLVSARLSPRNFRRLRRLGPLWRPTFTRLAAVGAATEEDAERFAELGVDEARIRCVGDLKLDRAQQASPPAEDLQTALAEGPVFVAGSTHPGEERAVADALERIEAEGRWLRTVIAPRHLERLSAVERECSARGRKVRRRSRLAEGPLAPGEIVLLDTMGELASVYGLADFAFVGGSLAPVGGHNILEPVASGVPVLHGPHVEKLSQAVAWLAGLGATTEVANADALGRTLMRWMRDPEAARLGARRGRDGLEREAGSVERSSALVQAVLRGSPLPELEWPGRPGSRGEGR